MTEQSKLAAWRSLSWGSAALLLFFAAGGGFVESAAQKENLLPIQEKPFVPPKVEVLKADALAKVVSSHKGKIVVVNYWATWCPPCLTEMPELVKFFKEMDDEKTVFLSVTIDRPSTVDKRVVPYLTKEEIPFPVIVLDAFPDKLIEVMELGDWEGAVPGTFVYDQSGKLVRNWTGEIKKADLDEALKPLLSRKTGGR